MVMEWEMERAGLKIRASRKDTFDLVKNSRISKRNRGK